MQRILLILFTLFVVHFATGQKWQSQLVWENDDGQLEYAPCEDGFLIPDFSHAGYKGGGVGLPELVVVKTIEPISGDNTAHIQTAINEVGNRTLNEQGFRGALLLKAGKYEVKGTLKIPFDGVALRGEGDGENPNSNTILYAIGNSPHQRDLLLVGNNSKKDWNAQTAGSKSNITSQVVPAGSTSFEVENSSLYAVGDQIIIYHPCSQKWLEAVNFGGVSDQTELWTVNKFPILFNRYITAIDNYRITVDAPIFNTLDRTLTQSYIYKPKMDGTIYNVGIENLRIDIETLGGTDENHAWHAVRFKSCENAWAKNCTFLHFGQSGIITEATTRSTFYQCKALDPVGIVTGERMYNFNTYHNSQLNLFEECYARNGRHNYVSNGTSTTSGNVFLNSISDGAQSVNEGHRHWTTGMLFDGHEDRNLRRPFVLGLYNRVDAGTGHGWSAAHSVLWNCNVTSGGVIAVQKPPTAQNYAIGCVAKEITGSPHSNSNFPLGYVEGSNQLGLYPVSLYKAQMADRMNISSTINAIEAKEKVHLYYNPSDNILLFYSEKTFLNGQGVVAVYDSSGRTVLHQKVDDLQSGCKLNQSLLPGLYLFTLLSEREHTAQKIIVR